MKTVKAGQVDRGGSATDHAATAAFSAGDRPAFRTGVLAGPLRSMPAADRVSPSQTRPQPVR